MSEHVVVLGGSGFVGRAVVAELQSRGVAVRSGTNFGSGDVVTIEVTYQVAMRRLGLAVPADYVQRRQQTVVADANGAFTTNVTLTQVGLATVTATGAPSGLTASATVRVLAAGAAMPVTGDDANYLGLALIGSAVVAAGVIIAVIARSRRRRPIEEPEA